MIENQFNTGGIIKWEDIEGIKRFIQQTNGQYISKEEYEEIVELIKNSPLTNVEIPTL